MKAVHALPGGAWENFTAYSATSPTVAGLTAEEDAAFRLMRMLADQIVTRLIATSGSWGMILKGIEATRYFAKPDTAKAGLLIAGADPMRVALKRQEVIAALIGPEGEAEMRLTRIPASDLRKDGAALMDATRAMASFPARAWPLSRMRQTRWPR